MGLVPDAEIPVIDFEVEMLILRLEISVPIAFSRLGQQLFQ